VTYSDPSLGKKSSGGPTLTIFDLRNEILGDSGWSGSLLLEKREPEEGRDGDDIEMLRNVISKENISSAGVIYGP
jgi:hypothetical protein